LNKCIHRIEQHGFIESNSKTTHFSSRLWYSCNLINENLTRNKRKCIGWNCNRGYKEKKI